MRQTLDEQFRRGVSAVGEPCRKCHGSGWLWFDELEDSPSHDTTGLFVDERYPCDACQTREVATPVVTPEPLPLS
jgi:hypothetical protein